MEPWTHKPNFTDETVLNSVNFSRPQIADVQIGFQVLLIHIQVLLSRWRIFFDWTMLTATVLDILSYPFILAASGFNTKPNGSFRNYLYLS